MDGKALWQLEDDIARRRAALREDWRALRTRLRPPREDAAHAGAKPAPRRQRGLLFGVVLGLALVMPRIAAGLARAR